MKERVIASIKRGEVVILPLEYGYVYACDAFSLAGVNRLHQLRNDPRGIAAQVIIGKVEILGGLAQGLTPAVQDLAREFWPGMLTLKLPQNQSLNWDLGDGGTLKEFAVRVPNRSETLEVLNETGPLAIASATFTGGDPVTLAPTSSEMESIDIGEILAGPLSTVVAADGEKVTVIRVGALTFEELRKVVSAIELASE